MDKFKLNNNVVFSSKYHVVWCPKYRREVLIGDVENRLKEIVGDVCGKLGAEIIEMETMPDHISLLVGIHRLIKRIKGQSSRLLRAEFASLKSRLPTLWTNSYFLATVGGTPLSIISQYIERQKTS